ncbi:MAG: hypothetical protein L6R38_002426 [Xanthoria sp. 2 TBL-2021]|nr:MAG: hypothetical protein L6R38_002426 [Xanthoria sp. 2 TBL-2021]
MPSLRSRTSPLKFFASSSSTPRAESQQEREQAWQRDYLNGLRSYRPTRPVGARPAPNHGDNPLRTTSAMSFRPSLPMRQSSPTRLPEEERCSSAKPLRESASRDLSSSSDSADQSHPANELDAVAIQNGALLGHPHQPGVGTMAMSSTSRTSSGMYRERGQRLVEKEEARMLREALELVDQQQEARLLSAAQLEASELVWKHQNPEDLPQTADVPYLYKQPLRIASHVRSQSDVPVTTSTEFKESHGWIKRSPSDHSDEGRGKISKILVPDGDAPESPQSQTLKTDSIQHNAEAVNHSEKTQGQASNGHSLWDSPQKKAYMNLNFTLPQIKLSGRRRSSGSKTRIPSGSLFSNPNDKIYEETEEKMHGTGKSTSIQAAKPVPFHAVIQNPTAKTTGQPLLRSMTDPAESKDNYSRTEIYRNPPSQSRNPSYLRNGLSSTAPHLADDHDLATQAGTPDAREVRSDDIRAATSMRLKDRSPKLPSPTVVSNAKGRPIVSFDKNWAPSTADIKRQDLSPQRPGSRDRDCRPLATNRSKPILPNSIASAPVIPTINAPEPPSIHIEEAPSVPSISVSPIPTFSVSAAEAPSSSNGDNPKPSRPLPSPRKSIPKPTGRPVPHHSSTAPVHTSLPHWSPSQRRATAQCAACALPISGRIVSAASQRFHPECFTCFHCSEQLECVAFYPEPDTFRTERITRIQARTEGLEVPDEVGKTWEDDGDESLRFYCHLDYHERFSPRCRSCKTPIEGEVVVACGGQWHVGHFFCAQCGDPFDQKTPFVEKDGYAWCVGCHTNRFSGKCRGCRKPVVDLVVRALGGEWHESCFCCKECAGPFEDGRFFTRGDEEAPVCVKCEERRLKA